MSIQRDYKPASTWQRRRQAVRRHGLLVLTLALIGLFGGALAYIRKGDAPPPASPATTAAPTATVAPVSKVNAPSAPTPAKGGAVTAPTPTPTPLESVPPLPKPKYDFYTELPKRQINVRREEPKPLRSAQPPTRLTPTTPVANAKASRKQNNPTPTVATPAGGIKLISPKKTIQASATNPADQNSKSGSTRKNAQGSTSVAAKVNDSKAATGKKSAQTPGVTSRSEPGSTASSRNTTAPVISPGSTAAKSATATAAPIRHITTPTGASRSAAPLRNATTPTAAHSGSRSDQLARPVSVSRQTRPAQPLNPGAPVAVKIE